MKSLRTLSLTTFLLCTMLLAPAMTLPLATISSGTTTGSVLGGFELTLRGTCFATIDVTGWDASLFGQPVEQDTTQSNLGVGTIILPVSPGRLDGTYTLSLSTGTPSQSCNIQPSSTITYAWANTPTLEAIVPSAANSGSDVFFYGTQRITDPSDITYINIGSNGCYFPTDTNDPNELIASEDDYVTCTTPTNEPGYYNVSQVNGLNTGTAWVFDTVHNYVLSTGGYYDFVVIPQITALSSNSGSYLGQILNIFGSGFASFSSNTVQFAATECVVWYQSATQITCQVQEVANINVEQTVYHSGIKREQFAGTNHLNIQGSAQLVESVLDGEVYGNSGTFVSKLSGYFLAPASGDYVFTLAGSWPAYLYFNPTAGAAPSSYPGSNPIAQIGTSTPYRFPWVNSTKTVSDPVTNLVAGSYYYFEAYTETQGTEDLSIGVKIPGPLDNSNQWSTLPDVQLIQAGAPYTPLSAQIVIQTTSLSGYFYGKFAFSDGSFYTFSYSGQIPVGATALQVQNALPYPSTVTLVTASTTNPTTYTYTYTVTFNAYTGAETFIATTVYNVPAGQSSSLPGGSANTNNIISESPILSGTFQIYTGQPNPPKVNVQGTATDLANALRNSGITPLTRVYKILSTSYAYSWVFAFYGQHGPQPLVNVVDYSLTGGLGHDPANPNSGSNGIYLNVYKIQDGTWDTYYDAIPNHLLRTAHTTSDSQITVSANGVYANCPGFNCGYSVTTNIATVTPVLASVTQSNLPALALTVANLKYTQTAADFNNVTFGGEACSVTSYTTQTSTTGLLTINCPTPAFGTYQPVVHLNNFGYAAYEGNSITIPGSITRIYTSNGNGQIPANGGEVISIEGTAFPPNLQTAISVGLTITVGTANCALQSSTSTEITCLLGAQNAGYNPSSTIPVTLAIGAVTLSNPGLPVQNTYPQINSVSPSQLNPVLQQYITFTGTNFDATDEYTSIYFRNVATSDVFECDVSAPASTTTITCFYLGIISGNYKVYAITSQGKSNEVDVLISVDITGISPSSGSIEGGTTLTIEGGIFASDITQTLVYLGPENNYLLCDVISSSSHQVQCVTEPSVWGYSTQTVLLATRIQDESTCSIAGGCQFSYTVSSTPQITSASSNGPFNPGDSITYQTLNLGSSPPTVSSNGISLTVTSFTAGGTGAGALTIQIPNNFPPAINASVNILVGNLGYATFTTGTASPTINVSLSLTSVSPNTGPTSGALLTLVGNGFTSLTQVNIGTNNLCLIRTVTSTQITCAAYHSGTITIVDPVYQTPIRSSSGTSSITLSGSGPTTPSISPVYNGNQVTLQLSSSGFTSGAQSIYLTSNSNSSVTFGQTGVLAGNTATFVFTGLPAGNWQIEVASNTKIVVVSSWVLDPTITSSGTYTSSIGGGYSTTLSGSHFSTNFSQNIVTVCGLPATVTAASFSSLTISTPAFSNSVTKVSFPSLVPSGQLNGFWTGDVQSQVYTVYDNNPLTSYISSSSSCYIEFDVGNGAVADLEQFIYLPAIGSDPSTFDGIVFEASNDNSAWTTLYTLAGTNNAYNYWVPSTPISSYRYFKISGSGTSSNCNFAELQYTGYLRSASNSDPATGATCPVVVNVNGATVTSNVNIDYTTSATPVLSSFTPAFGTSAGGTIVSFTGSNFGASPTVYIDDTECPIYGTPTATLIQCTTAQAPSIANRRNSFESAIIISFTNGNAITSGAAYFYVDLWSSINTWNGIVPPRDGDSVLIPPGQNILVDVTPNLLNAVVVEGGLFFANGNDVDFNAYYILVDGGRLQIGTSAEPITSNVVITLYGTRNNPSLPIAGNKMIANINGLVDIHGQQVNTPWTTLASTASAGATSIVVNGDVHTDWQVGDNIVIASTDFDHKQAEEVTISSLSYNSGKTTIVLTTALVYSHYSGTQTVQGASTETVTFAAEVGLLTRTVVVQGDPTSDVTLHGANIITFSQTANGQSITRISNTEIYRAGQAYLVGSYAVYYRSIGSALASYFTGNAVHDSYNRALAIQASQYLTVSNNVAYNIKGHAFYLETGSETYNEFTGNLVVSVHASAALLLTDQIPACYYITNPNNIFNNNACGGGDGQGFWFMLPDETMGASECQNICPSGIPLGSFDGNSAHSNANNGLRIYPEWIPRTNPCKPWVDWTQESNPFAVNFPIQATLNNFITWKNKIDGIASERSGAILFNNPIVADNIRAGIEVSVGRFTTTQLLLVNNAIIIGQSNNNAPGEASDYQQGGGARGLVLPRSDFFYATTVIFHNFPTGTTAVETCSHCEYGPTSDSGGRTNYLQGIYYSGTVTQKLRFNYPYKDIVFDIDGSFTLSSAGTSVTYFWEHLNDSSICPVNTVFDGIVCIPSISLRRVVFWDAGAVGTNDLRLLRVDYDSDLSEPQLVPIWRFSTIFWRYWQLPMNNWAFVTIVGKTYKYHWANGIDFSTLYFLRGDTFVGADYVNIVNNHTGPRETYGVTDYRTSGAVLNIAEAPALWYEDATATAARSNGDWYHESDENLFWIILKAQLNGTFFVQAYACLLYCPQIVTYPVGNGNPTEKYWCTGPDWPSLSIPQPGQDIVTIDYGWIMHLDCTTYDIQILLIYGTLLWDDTGDYTLNAQAIWVIGDFLIGNSTNPFQNIATIYFWGDIDAASLDFPVIDLNKAILVTGNFIVYGSPPSILWSPLAVSIVPPSPADLDNPFTITIIDDVTDIWQLSDEVLIETSFVPGNSEILTIASAPTGNQVTLKSGPKYPHYGGPAPFSTPGGEIDYRARVGVLTRNIVITAEQTDDWGCRVYVTQYEGYRGYVYLSGVEIAKCGQANASVGALEFDYLSKTGVRPSVFQNSTIHQSWSYILLVTSSNLVTINNNIFARAYGSAIVFSGELNQITLSNNWITAMSVATSNNPDFIYVNWNTNFRADGASFTQGTILNNKFSDCGGTCASIGGGDCYDNPVGPWTYSGNVAAIGGNGVTFGDSSTTCSGLSSWTVYGISQTAIATAANAQNVLVTSVNVVDAAYGFSLNTGGQDNVTITLSHSFIGGSIDDETYYTNNSLSCSGRIGYIASTSNSKEKSLPIWGPTLPWRRQFLEGAWQNIANIYDNTFYNWKANSETKCQNNYIFTNDDLAQNSQAIHLISDSTKASNSVDFQHVFFFIPHENTAESISLCGGWSCTGYLNVIFKDLDGTLSGIAQGATAFPALTTVKQATCASIIDPTSSDTVGYECPGTGWGILAFESEDFDRETRVFSPVNITRPDGFRNDLNAMQEEDANYPDNWVRLARFYSIIQTAHNYSIYYLGSLPSKEKFQLQGLTQNDWVIVRQRYDQPYIISLSFVSNNSVIRSSILGPDGVADLSATGCGGNYYYGVEQIVEFKLTGRYDCVLYATVTNGVKGVVRYVMDVNSFYALDGPTQFIDRVADVLGIDLSTIRVASVVSGSTIVDFTVATPTQGTPTTEAQQTQINSEISTTISKLQTAISTGQLNILGTTVLDSSFTGSSAGNPTGVTSPTTSTVDSKIIIIAAALGGLVLIIGAVIIVKRLKKKDESKVPGGFFDVKKSKSPRKIGTRVFPLPKDLQSPSEKAPVIVDLESMADTHAPKVGSTELSQRKFLDSESSATPVNNQIINLEAPTKSKQQLKNPFE